MATKKKRRPASHAPKRRRTSTSLAPKKRRRSLSAGPRNLMAAVKPNLAGAAGGIGYALTGQFVPEKARPWVGLAAGVVLSYFGLNNVGVGFSGASAFDYASRVFGLSDGMQQTDYVNPIALSDNYELSDSETMDNAGNVYQLSADGQNLEYVGTIPGLQGISMEPLYTYN